ncbi:MAG: glycosyltransferase family 2 protein, partial [Kiritimatiellia bacterium]|nr:glycosyltransferase family 2 protein [Kiritimatiellia bacterium]
MKTKIICMTPVKNEAWILKRFLTCASLWADHIIVADQDSSDTSREIAASFPKVILIENPSAVFNEPQRQKMLIDEARKIAGPKILIALDADEMLPPGAWESPEWRTMLESPPGTVILFRWANICHGWRQMWISDSVFPGGYVDDGASHEGRDIHSPRVPCPEGANGVEMTETKVLHLQYTDWQRMESKHRWYQVWERLN